MSRKYQKDYAESVGKHHDFADDKGSKLSDIQNPY
jgi:hypothetical protein